MVVIVVSCGTNDGATLAIATYFPRGAVHPSRRTIICVRQNAINISSALYQSNHRAAVSPVGPIIARDRRAISVTMLNTILAPFQGAASDELAKSWSLAIVNRHPGRLTQSRLRLHNIQENRAKRAVYVETNDLFPFLSWLQNNAGVDFGALAAHPGK